MSIVMCMYVFGCLLLFFFPFYIIIVWLDTIIQTCIVYCINVVQTYYALPMSLLMCINI